MWLELSAGIPISMAAAKATIEQLEGGQIHEQLTKSGEYLRKELTKLTMEAGIRAMAVGFGSIFTLYFMEKEPQNYRELRRHNDDELFKICSSTMHDQGIFIPPQAYKMCHISASHSMEDLRKTIKSATIALSKCSARLKDRIGPL